MTMSLYFILGIIALWWKTYVLLCSSVTDAVEMNCSPSQMSGLSGVKRFHDKWKEDLRIIKVNTR